MDESQPTKPDNESMTISTNGTVELMKEAGIPVTRENYLKVEFLGEVPDPVPPEVELEMPNELRLPPYRKD